MKKIIVVVVLLGLIVVGYLVLIPKSTSPLSAKEKEAALTRILDRPPVLEEKKAAPWQTFHGKFVTVAYPKEAIFNKIKVSSNLEEGFSASSLVPKILLSVQVIRGNNLTDSSAVTFRQQDPKVYTKEKQNFKGREGLVFTKVEEGVEKAAFILSDGRIISVVVSGYNLNDVTAFYKQVFSTLQF